MLNQDIDTVYIATPNHLHSSLARKCLESGLNIIVEKPFSTRYNDACKIAELANKKNLFAFEAITTQYLPAYKIIQQNIDKIGKITHIECNFFQRSSRFEKFLKGELSPVFNAKCHGGALMDLNCYNIHFVVGLLGLPYEATYNPEIINNIDTEGTATLSYDGFNAKCCASKSRDGNRYCKIIGTKGTIQTTDTASLICDVVLIDKGGKPYTLFKSNPNDSFNSRAIYEFEDIANSIDSNDKNFCKDKLQTTLNVIKVLSELSIF